MRPSKISGTEDRMKRLDLIKNWILKSGIQNKDGNFNSWYDLNRKQYHSIYSEITGYGITTLLYLGHTKKARKAADWIIDNAMHFTGGIKTRLYYIKGNENPDYSFDGGLLYTFDTGIVLFGLAALYEITKEKRYFHAARKMGNFILNAQKDDGSIYSFYNQQLKDYESTFSKWSTQSGAFHAKIAMGLTKLGDITGDMDYTLAALRLCDYAVRTQEPDGRFITLDSDNSTNMHPHCYAAEGLLYCGIMFEEKRYVRAAVKAVRWAYNNKPEERTDILAQLIRLGCMLNQDGWLGGEIIDGREIFKHLKKLMSFQYRAKSQKGGILFNRSEPHVNSWCSMFALQALNYTFHENMDMGLLI